MRFRTTLVLASCLVAISFSPASAAVIFSDDFESYADTGEMNAVWANGGTATLDTTAGNPNNPGNSMHHPGNGGSGENTNSVSVSVTPGAGEILRYTADIYDDALNATKRVSAGLRDGAGSNILEMGMYSVAPGPHYAYRVILFPGGDVNWQVFSGITDDAGNPIANEPVEGWHRYNVDVTPTSATFTLDLGSTGIVNATAVVGGLTIGPNGFNQIRLGGPSDVTSSGGGANFDNVSLSLIPEPTSLALLGIAMVGLAFFRRQG